MIGVRIDPAPGCIILIKNSRGKHIDLLLQEDVQDYYLVKGSNSFRLLYEEEFRTYCYAGYIFFDKKIYDINHIEMWLKFIKENKMGLTFMTKPFPDFDPQKIIVRNGR